MKNKAGSHLVLSFAAALSLLTAQISLGDSATWLFQPQDSAWENANNWTAGGPPNGPSDIATFAQSSQRDVNVSTTEEVNSIVFTSNANSFGISMLGGTLTFSGNGIINNSSVLQTFVASDAGWIIFNNTSTAAGASIKNSSLEFAKNRSIGRTIFNGASTADHASISNDGPQGPNGEGGQTRFDDTSTAGNASIHNWGTGPATFAIQGQTIFNDLSSAGHATITSHGGASFGGLTIFNDSSTADSSILVADGEEGGGGILFGGSSTGGTAQVKVFDNGYLELVGHQPTVTVGSIEGSGNVFLDAKTLRVGANGIDSSFSGVISGGGSMAKIGNGVLTLQTNHCIAATVGLILVSGSIINLDFTGSPDVVASLKVNGVPQPSGIYGGPMSGAPHIVPEFQGTGSVHVLPSTLGNISTRAFVQTGDNVVIGGFIVEGDQPKRVIIRAIGPELTQYGVPNVLINPTLELHDGTGALIASNDNWQTTIIGGIITSDQRADIRNSGYAPGDGRESAIIAELPAGNYTAIVRGVNDMTGVALVEVYDLSPETNSILGNISTRSFVQTDDNVMIGGFIVQGTQPKRVIVRAIGPELGAPPYNIPNALANPTLELHNGAGHLIASNDNWRATIIGGIITSDQVRDILRSGHAPSDPRESAIIANLLPGNYTAIVRGANNTTGVGLVEVYDLD